MKKIPLMRKRLYGNFGPWNFPVYGINEAAAYLSLPVATVRSWTLGRTYPTAAGRGKFQPVVPPADPKQNLLSFRNLVEIFVLGAIRRKYNVGLATVRKAVLYLQKELKTPRPLSDVQFFTDGESLLVERFGRLVNVSQAGQLELKKIMAEYLRRIERSPEGVPVCLYPFVTNRLEEKQSAVAINPLIQFGRPCIAGTGIPTAVVAERYKAGDGIAEMAGDYGRKPTEIEDALRYELNIQAA